LGAASSVVDGTCKDDAVGFGEKCVEFLEVILDDALFVFEAVVAVGTIVYPFSADRPQFGFKSFFCE